MVRSGKCEELEKQLRAKWEKRNVLIASGTEEFWRTDEEVARLIVMVQESCGAQEAQRVIDEIWKARI